MMTLVRSKAIATLCAFSMALTAVPVQTDAGIFRNLFGHRQTTNYMPACTACYAPAASNCHTCARQVYRPVTQRVCRYVPQTRYRNVYVNVPVTAYRPVTTCDPCTGCSRTSWHPVTTTARQVRRVAYTAYRQVWSNVTYYAPAYVSSPCGTCSTGCATGCSTGCAGGCATGGATTTQGGLPQPKIETYKKPIEKEKSVTGSDGKNKATNYRAQPKLLPPVDTRSLHQTTGIQSRRNWSYTPAVWIAPTAKQAKSAPARTVELQNIDSEGWEADVQ